jgi:hypothetical protein
VLLFKPDWLAQGPQIMSLFPTSLDFPLPWLVPGSHPPLSSCPQRLLLQACVQNLEVENNYPSLCGHSEQRCGEDCCRIVNFRSSQTPVVDHGNGCLWQDRDLRVKRGIYSTNESGHDSWSIKSNKTGLRSLKFLLRNFVWSALG